MNFKVISTETIAENKLAFLKGKISALKMGLNIFSGSEASQLIDDLLEAKESGINLRELFSKIKGLEFLEKDSKPIIDPKADTEIQKKQQAQKSIYTCLEKLSEQKKVKIQEVLARDFKKLGFKTKGYTPIEPGWLGKELRIAAGNGTVLDVQKLLDGGADIEAKDNDGWTALMYAAFRGEKGCVDLLLKAGAKIDEKDILEMNALMNASWEGETECVDLLLKAGANIDEKDDNGWTALMLAASNKSEGCVDLLLKAGANIDEKTDNGSTALDLAKEAKHTEVVRLLEAAMEDQS